MEETLNPEIPVIEFDDFEDLLKPEKKEEETIDALKGPQNPFKDEEEKEEEEIEEETIEDVEEPEGKEELEEDQVIEVYYQTLKDLGHLDLPEDYKFDGNIEEALNVSNRNKESKLAEKLIDNMPPRGKEILEYILNGGSDITSYEKLVHDKFDIEELEVETEEDATKIVTQYYKDKGLTEKRIKFIIDGLTDEEELIAEGTKLKEEMVQSIDSARKKKKEDDLKAAEELEKANLQIRQSIIEEIKKDDSLDDKGKLDTYNFIIQPKENGRSEIMEKIDHISRDPSSLITLAKLLKKYDTKTNSWDLSELENKATSKVARNMKDEIRKSLTRTRKGQAHDKKLDSLLDVEPVL